MTGPRWLIAVGLLAAGAGAGLPTPAAAQGPDPTAGTPSTAAASASVAVPLAFIGNDGEFDPRGISFFSRGAGSALLSRSGGLALWLGSRPAGKKSTASAALKPSNLDLAFVRAGRGQQGRSTHRVTGIDQLPGVVNQYTGARSDQWHTGAPLFGALSYTGLWPGVSLIVHGVDGALEQDFQVSPGGRTGSIRVRFSHQQRAGIDRAGNLVFSVGGRTVVQRRPTAYQSAGGAPRTVAVRYASRGRGMIGVRVGTYDHRLPLMVTAVLAYPTGLTPRSDAGGEGVALDSAGNIYVAGNLGSAQFPRAGPAQERRATQPNAFVAKLNPAGTAIAYITYVGGDAYDLVSGIAVDAQGEAYVTGVTDSDDFPTFNALQSKLNGATDAFVFKLSPDGKLGYSTYLGGHGTEQGGAIAADSSGSAYITGLTRSPDFPVTANAVQTRSAGGPADAFVTKLSPDGKRLVYSTYLGGRGDDEGGGIAVDGAGDAYLTGLTDSPDFPTRAALQVANRGHANAFVTKLDPSAGKLVYSTYLGGRGTDSGSGIAVDEQGDTYVALDTTSPDLPTPFAPPAHQAFQPSLVGGTDVYVARLNPPGSGLDYGTYLGGTRDDRVGGIAVDAQHDLYITGNTLSTDFPTQSPLQATNSGGQAGFATELDRSGSLMFSTYFGSGGSTSGNAIAVDSSGIADIVGETGAGYFPPGNPLQPGLGSASSAFLFRVSAGA